MDPNIDFAALFNQFDTIALDSGFADQSHFTSVFRRMLRAEGHDLGDEAADQNPAEDHRRSRETLRTIWRSHAAAQMV